MSTPHGWHRQIRRRLHGGSPIPKVPEPEKEQVGLPVLLVARRIDDKVDRELEQEDVLKHGGKGWVSVLILAPLQRDLGQVGHQVGDAHEADGPRQALVAGRQLPVEVSRPDE